MSVYAVDISQSFLPAQKFGSIGAFVNIMTPLLFMGASTLFLAMLLYGGYVWITSGENPENIKRAQKIITFAVLGIFIVALSGLAVRLIGVVLNVSNIIKI